MALLIAALVAPVAACNAGGQSPGTASAQPFAGKTIQLISSGAAGSSHDLLARAMEPYLATYLHATVHVVDMPGGGQLLAWNYIAHQQPDSLTIGTIDVEGVLANLWEKVHGQKVNPATLTMLGGGAGGVAGEAQVMFAAQSANPIFGSVYRMVADRTRKVLELGSVGDVPGPLFFKLYHIPYRDLSSYSDSSAELQGMLRGDGDISVKSWAGSWATYVTSGKGRALLDFSMRPAWQVDPSVPTVAQLLKRAPITGPGRAALVADSTALDAGVGLFGPPGMPQSEAALLRRAVAYAYSQPGFIKDAKNGGLSTIYESFASEASAIKSGLQPQVIKDIREFVPLSTGVAS
jgi:tripartite-type tricarboxylate transporter receptor subunit TctC